MQPAIAIQARRGLLRRCAGACLWTCAAATAALALLALYVLAIEVPSAAELAASLATPLNLSRLVVMTACLGLWGFIAHSIRGVPPAGPRAIG
ncbi:hypothetical protein GCM10028862_21860 [Luteimonas pelagia]